jgi:hypothetical protein
VNLRERDGELTPEEDAAYSDGYREGFDAGARMQRDKDAYWMWDHGPTFARELEGLPLVTPPEPE